MLMIYYFWTRFRCVALHAARTVVQYKLCGNTNASIVDFLPILAAYANILGEPVWCIPLMLIVSTGQCQTKVTLF